MNLRILFTAALITALFPATAGADDLPDSATIRARNAAAAGPVPASYREIITYTSGKDAGTQTLVRRVSDFRLTTDSTVGRTIAGSYKGEQWLQNSNGHTVVIDPDPGLATSELLTTNVKRVSEPADAYEISTLNSRGYGSINDYDAKTWLLVRHVDTGSTGNITTTYDDFRTYGERHMAAHWHVHNESSKLDSDYHVMSFSASEIADDEVNIVPNRRQIVEFPDGVSHVDLPAKFLKNGHVIVPVKIGDRSYDFVLDTGAGGIMIDPAIAGRLKLPILNPSSNSSNAGRIQTGKVLVPEMKIGDLTLHNVFTTVVPQGMQEDANIETVGLLGFDFLCELGITIDYEHQKVRVDRFGAFERLENAVAIPVRLGSLQPMTTVTINGAIAERMLIDTGAADAPVFLFNYFARRHPEALVDHDGKGAAAPKKTFSGIGGSFAVRAYAFDRFMFGNVAFRDFVGYVVTGGAYATTIDGLIGAHFLQYFKVQLDYPDGIIFVQLRDDAQDLTT